MNINDFCATNDYIKHLRQPFNLGNKTIATNRVAIVIIPADEQY